MPRNVLSTVFKLFIASLIVGMLMRWFDVTPRSLIANFGHTVERVFSTISGFLGWALDYVLLGACIVLPIWLIVFLIDRAKSKRGGS